MNISRLGFIIVAAFALGMFAGRAGGLDEARFSQPLPYDLGLTVARPDSQVNIDRDSLAEMIAEVPCKEANGDSPNERGQSRFDQDSCW